MYQTGVVNKFNEIDFFAYTTPFNFYVDRQNKDNPLSVINNNTNIAIPYDFIKNIYLNDIKNADGKMLKFDRSLSYYNTNRNEIIFNACDKIQSAKTKISVELISGVLLTSKHEREVNILD